MPVIAERHETQQFNFLIENILGINKDSFENQTHYEQFKSLLQDRCLDPLFLAPQEIEYVNNEGMHVTKKACQENTFVFSSFIIPFLKDGKYTVMLNFDVGNVFGASNLPTTTPKSNGNDLLRVVGSRIAHKLYDSFPFPDNTNMPAILYRISGDEFGIAVSSEYRDKFHLDINTLFSENDDFLYYDGEKITKGPISIKKIIIQNPDKHVEVLNTAEGKDFFIKRYPIYAELFTDICNITDESTRNKYLLILEKIFADPVLFSKARELEKQYQISIHETHDKRDFIDQIQNKRGYMLRFDTMGILKEINDAASIDSYIIGNRFIARSFENVIKTLVQNGITDITILRQSADLFVMISEKNMDHINKIRTDYYQTFIQAANTPLRKVYRTQQEMIEAIKILPDTVVIDTPSGREVLPIVPAMGQTTVEFSNDKNSNLNIFNKLYSSLEKDLWAEYSIQIPKILQSMIDQNNTKAVINFFNKIISLENARGLIRLQKLLGTNNFTQAHITTVKQYYTTEPKINPDTHLPKIGTRTLKQKLTDKIILELLSKIFNLNITQL